MGGPPGDSRFKDSLSVLRTLRSRLLSIGLNPPEIPMSPSKNDVSVRPRRAKRLPIRMALARPRLLATVLIGILVVLFLPRELAPQPVTRAIVGWNVTACLYCVLALKMMFGSSHERMRTRALEQEEGNTVVLLLVVTASLMCVAASASELVLVKSLTGLLRDAHLALVALTIVSSWVFTQTMFALHYAHDYYLNSARGDHGGLDFPGGLPPDYGDFLYFACVIGTSGQTADVSFSSRRMRRTGTVHCVLAFFFNTTLLALMINIASGLL